MTGVATTWSAEQIVLSHFTLERHHDIAERVEWAAAAGYDGIGLYIGNWARLRDSGELGRLDELLTEHDLALCDIEVLRGWGTVGLDDPGYAQLEADCFAMADRYGCRYVQAIGDVVDDHAEAARRFGALCDRAADHGLVVGLEFLPFTNIVDSDAGRAIVETADRPNGGLCVDIWHHRRGTNDDSQLAKLSADIITGIQMNDGPLQPTEPDDYVADCLRYRVPPGEGEMAAQSFVETLLAVGADVPWQMEVCNAAAVETDGFAHVKASLEGMQMVLAAARAATGGATGTPTTEEP